MTEEFDTPEGEQELSDDVISIYAVELLSDQPFVVDKAELLERLRVHCGNVEPMDGEEDSDLLAFVHLDHVIEYDEGSMPVQHLLATSDEPVDLELYEEALQQTWDWPEAREVASRCTSSLLITDLMARGLEYHIRLSLFHCVLQAVLEVVPCLAIHWQSSRQVLDPTVYLTSQQPGEDFDPLYGAINVRLFNVQERAKGETVMDTMGLAVFGLPDLQCHFTGLNPNQVAGVLYNAAYYIFDQGDVIEDGHTIPGIEEGQVWQCQHESSLVPPERVVIDLNPGPPYAAGQRGG